MWLIKFQRCQNSKQKCEQNHRTAECSKIHTSFTHSHIAYSLIWPLQQNWCYGGEWSGIIYLNCSLMNKAIALTLRVKKTCHIWYRKWSTSSFLNEKKYLNNYEKDITQTNPSEIIFEVNQMKPIFLKKKRLTEAVIRRCSSK